MHRSSGKPIRDPDLPAGEHFVEVLAVRDEGVGVRVVEVEGDDVDVVTIGFLHEPLDPLDTAGRGRDGGTNVDGRVDGFDVLPPKRDGLTDAHGGPIALSGFVEGEDVGPLVLCMTFFSQAEICLLPQSTAVDSGHPEPRDMAKQTRCRL